MNKKDELTEKSDKLVYNKRKHGDKKYTYYKGRMNL